MLFSYEKQQVFEKNKNIFFNLHNKNRKITKEKYVQF